MYNTDNLRKASEVTDMDFPYTSSSVNYILITKDGIIDYVQYSKRKGYPMELIEMFKKAKLEETTIIAPWEGTWRTDLFVIDDFDKAIEILYKYSL